MSQINGLIQMMEDSKINEVSLEEPIDSVSLEEKKRKCKSYHGSEWEGWCWKV
jgi:hypothetical protein